MHTLSTIPLFSHLQSSQKILIAGAGGGFDIFSGIALYFALKNQGKQVFLANLSFTNLPKLKNTEKIHEVCWKVTHAKEELEYFPEGHLCEWLRAKNEDSVIYSFNSGTGISQLAEAYQLLWDMHKLEAIVLVDGGTDSLMRGDEYTTGSPGEDISSILAVHQVAQQKAYLACLGFGIDRICHYQFLENTADLLRNSGFLGAFSLLPSMPEAQLYMEVVQYLNEKIPSHPSIICNSIVSSLESHYGDYHATHRTQGSELWINPLMAMYWNFHLPAIVEKIMYPPKIQNTRSWAETMKIIIDYRKSIMKKPWQSIPL